MYKNHFRKLAIIRVPFKEIHKMMQLEEDTEIIDIVSEAKNDSFTRIEDKTNHLLVKIEDEECIVNLLSGHVIPIYNSIEDFRENQKLWKTGKYKKNNANTA